MRQVDSRCRWAAMGLVLLLAACTSGVPVADPAAGSAPPPAATESLGSRAEAVVRIDGRLTFAVELASTNQQKRRGLSGRASLSPGTGMLFLYAEPSVRSVWMPDMHFPIDIAWIAGGEVVEVATLHPCVEADLADCASWGSPGPIDYLLEVPAGSLEGVTPGASVLIEDRPRLPGSS